MPAVSTFVTFFSDERSARHFIHQLSLDAAITAITFLNQDELGVVSAADPSESANTLQQLGFSLEQCESCLSNLQHGGIAVLIEGNNAADILFALQEHGVQGYHMA